MLIPFLIVVIFIVDGVVEREAINVAIDASCDDFSVVVGNSDVLNVVGKGK